MLTLPVLILLLWSCASGPSPGAADTGEAQAGEAQAGEAQEQESLPESREAVRRIRDLEAGELAKYAQAGYMSYDFNPISARLLFHGLLRQPNNPELLLTTANVLVDDSPELAAVVFEYLFAGELEMSREQREELQTSYTSAMWVWGLSSKRDGSGEIAGEDFTDPSLFEFNRQGYRALFRGLVAQAGGLEQAVRGVQTILGLYAGFLAHRKGPDYEFDRREVFRDQRFALQPVYGRWLQQPVEEQLSMLETF
jgi:hypothetical protein